MKVTLIGFGALFVLWGIGVSDEHTEDDDEVVTKALDLLPPLADVVHAQVGRPRVEALNAVHSKAAALMKAVVDHSDAAGRLGAYAADRDKLKEHGRKVSAALSAMLGDMVRDRGHRSTTTRRPDTHDRREAGQLVLQALAPVIAKALGYHDKTATRLVTEAGRTWSRYAPGDHQR
ncbi:hypothetical protein [Streptomyces sp. NPDC012888]|uniref:hypothetical protein n=1 Tax=Streptomyces sp. NPDC012888 TaxID=3364855 RepID=UPI00369003E8